MFKEFSTPVGVAVVGASRDPEKLGYKILKNVIDGGYKGPIYPVNPKSKDILGLPCYPDITSLPGTPELAVVVVPAPFVGAVAEECGKKGTKGMVVISAGFKEAGAEGKKREQDLVAVMKKYGMRLIGPNCLGLIDVVHNLNASFAFETPPKGRIAFISQSGALGTAVLDWAMKEGVGFSKFFSVGNMAEVSESDLVEALGEDPDTDVILLYVEGIKDGRRFVEVARKVTKVKPVIVVKSGVTSSGLKAVSSHTGSLAGSDRAFEAAFAQSGVLRASSVQELFDYSLMFAYQPLLSADDLAIVTNAGGPSVMAVDAIERAGLRLAQLADPTRETLKSFLPAAANTNNPVDALGDVLAKPYGRTLDLVMEDPAVKGVIAILTPQVVTQPVESAQEVVRASRQHKKPVVACFMGGARMVEAMDLLSREQIPNIAFPERAVTALKGMSLYRTWREKPAGTVPALPGIDRARAEAVFAAARAKGAATLGDIEGREILSAYGIPAIESVVVTDPAACRAAAEKIGFPLVMKLVSPDILHKTEAGGVRVGISDAAGAERAYGEIVASAKKYKADAKIAGVQLQRKLEKATEVIIGVSADPQFGQLLMCGLGGIFVEVLKDVAFRVVPVTDADVREMIRETKGYKILKGFRNIPESDVAAIENVLLRVSRLCTDFPFISEMDINPLMVFEKGKGALAVDVRIAL